MKFLSPVLFIFLNCSFCALCFKTNKSLKLSYNINNLKKSRKNFNNNIKVYSSNEHLKQLKYVREVTNASIQICNNALKECNNDIEKAVELVRKNAKNSLFVSTSVKTQKEGLVAAGILDNKIVLIELLSDSDFVSRNDKFVSFVKNLVNIALVGEMPSLNKSEATANYAASSTTFTSSTHNIDNLLTLPYVDENGRSNETVGEHLNYLRNIFREDIKIGRFTKYVKRNEQEFLHFYIHNVIEGNNTVGLSGVLLVMNIETLNENLKTKKEDILNIADDLAMHILSAKPVSISVDRLNEKVVKRELDIIKESLKDLKKPENIITNMINGKIRKFYSSVVLLEQEYMLDDTKRKVSQVIKDFSKKHEININVEYFDNFIIGEQNILKD
ncbi:elongation factor ts, putative [Plasmodium malariae]|uniref:Elongation factor Ts, mitochondrial n=1 Tax=Plasmodium malariae TaxID=5858 RepID=A0A1C3KZ18_PLAMA|nr:elongation factor ts, putative [Plasmodium malariae]